MLFHNILVLASATIGALARPTQDVLLLSKLRPLVIWHGLGKSPLLGNGEGSLRPGWPEGDSYASSGMVQFQSLVAKIHPGIFIHSVYIDPDAKEDQRATFVRSPHAYAAGRVLLHSTHTESFETVRKRR